VLECPEQSREAEVSELPRLMLRYKKSENSRSLLNFSCFLEYERYTPLKRPIPHGIAKSVVDNTSAIEGGRGGPIRARHGKIRQLVSTQPGASDW
jgi:hypothetical protein